MGQDFRAFISFADGDAVWARKLRRALAIYRAPARAADDEPSPCAIAVADAPGDADHFLLIATPRAAADNRVRRELRAWLDRGEGAGALTCIVVEGEPFASGVLGKEPLECLPEALRDQRHRSVVIDAQGDERAWRSARTKLFARMTGLPVSAFSSMEARRRFWRGALFAGVTASLCGLALFAVERERVARDDALAATSRIGARAAQAALDRGDERAALEAVADAFAHIGEPAADDPAISREAYAALTRVALETRLLAEYAAPAGADVAEMRLLPDGVLAVVETGGRTHLLDPGAGDATTVYEPSRPTRTRISEDGGTIWTARFEPERTDDGGERYAPLLFEEAELATGSVRLATAVKSVPARGGDSAISPDGALFAVDLGPGAGEETVIAAFRREAQELAGVITVPSDRATLRFVDGDHLLAIVDPPSRWSGAPGLYLWRIGEPAAKTLRPAGAPPRCGPGDDPARMARPHFTLSPFAREAGFFIGGPGGGCFLRWSLPDGAQLRNVVVRENGARWGAALLADETYVYGNDDGGTRLLHPRVSAFAVALPGCGGDGLIRRLDRIGGRDVIFCSGGDSDALYYGPSGRMRWIGDFHDGRTRAVAYDRDRKRLFTIGDDRRLRIWDAAPRSSGVLRTVGAAHLTRAAGERIVIRTPQGAVATLTKDGEVLGDDEAAAPPPPDAAAHPAAGDCGPQDAAWRVVSPEGSRVAVGRAATGAGSVVEVLDAKSCALVRRFEAETDAVPVFADEARLWAPLRGEVAELPLTVDAARALKSVRARAMRLRPD